MREDTFDRIITEYNTRLIKYCYSILGNYHDAEDAAQETFIRLYYKLQMIINEKALAAYIYRIAYSVSIDMLRSGKRRKELAEQYGDSLRLKEDTYQMESAVENDGLLSEELYNALMTLKPADRALVHGKAVEELSYSELAVILGKSEGTLRKRYERARKKLVKEIDNREIGER